MNWPTVNELTCADPETFPGANTSSQLNCCAVKIANSYQEVRDMDETQFTVALALGYAGPDGESSRLFRWDATALSPDDDDSTVLKSSHTNVGRWKHTPV